MKTVTAIVVTYNNAATIGECLTSLQAAGVEAVIVVDNNSYDDSGALAAAAGALLISQKSNLGFATAVNSGAPHVPATCEYILCVNPDTALHPTAMKEALAYISAHPQVGIVGCLLRDKKTNHIERWSYGSFPTLVSLITRKFTAPAARQQPAVVDWVSGGCMLIRRSLFNQLKGFDPDFFLYWEDVDMCKRAKAAGYTTTLVPNAICHHLRGESSSDLQEKTHLYDASADRYFRKHYPLPIWGTHYIVRRLYRLFYPQVS